MKQTLFALLSATMLTVACSTQTEPSEQNKTATGLALTLPGDSTMYGLACEGSNDTILMVLRNLEQDPDTFDILNAMQFRRVMGRPSTGDLIAYKGHGAIR